MRKVSDCLLRLRELDEADGEGSRGRDCGFGRLFVLSSLWLRRRALEPDLGRR